MGLAVSPYAPAWNSTIRSPISACGNLTLSPSRSRGVHRQPTTVTASSTFFAKAVADCDRIVSPDHLPKVAGCGELVMQAAVDHQVLTSPRLLAIDDAGDVNAALADNVPAELDHHSCVGQVWLDCGPISSARLARWRADPAADPCRSTGCRSRLLDLRSGSAGTCRRAPNEIHGPALRLNK